MIDADAPDPQNEEGDADQLLRELGLQHAHHVDAFAAFGALGIRADPKAPRGCKGFGGGKEKIPRVVRMPLHGPALQLQRIGRHELGHIAMRVGGRDPPHVDRTADHTGLRFEMPRRGVLRAWESARGDLVQMAAAYPLVQPSDVYLRLGWALGWDVVFWHGRRRIPPANDHESLWDVFRESALLDAVRASHRPANDARGALAAPFEDPLRRTGIVILMPPRVA